MRIGHALIVLFGSLSLGVFAGYQCSKVGWSALRQSSQSPIRVAGFTSKWTGFVNTGWLSVTYASRTFQILLQRLRAQVIEANLARYTGSLVNENLIDSKVLDHPGIIVARGWYL